MIIFQFFRKEFTPVIELQNKSSTRWICQWKGIVEVIKTLGSILWTLEHFEGDVTSNVRRQHASLLLRRLDFEFIYSLIILKIILDVALTCTVVLQGEVNDLGRASNLVEVLMSNTQTCIEDAKPSG